MAMPTPDSGYTFRTWDRKLVCNPQDFYQPRGEESIAGAISTGTHGTGLRFGSLSTQIVGMNLVTAEGRLLQISLDQQPELMAAARVSLGALGVITQVTIQCVQAFNLFLQAE